jgi:chromosome segregation protein
MRLTRVEIHGFKSFADRTNLDLPKGLTAIVGPNGCGKSNVIDAVKWALGEQKASALRGSEMLDVIFKGNGARGARNFAEVSLLFDNSDGVMRTEFAEVVITRRLFRSGESEYLINKRSVRLKDVRDLLMDTGLGTGAYSVMEQGRIDAVLSANALERRRIFEEAAGISRYRARRREAESKLARTQQNLVRLADIVEELERRERSLKQQAGRARAYLAARDRIQLLKSRFYIHQYKSFGQQLEEQSGLVDSATGADAEARQAVEAARAEVTVLQTSLSETRALVDQGAEAFRKASGEVEALSERQTALRDRVAEAEERQALLEQRFLGLERALAERRVESEEILARFDAVALEVAGCQGEVDVSEAAFHESESVLSLARGAEELRRAEALGVLESLTGVRNERSEAEARRAGLEASRERLDKQVRELSDQKQVLAAEQGELFAGARDLEQTLAVAQQRVEQGRGRREALSAELVTCDAQLAEAREDHAGNDSHRRALDGLIERREGVTPGAKALLDANLPGVEGMLVDLLRAPAALADAVEAALGATTQAVLVSDRESGLAALAHLRRVQGGRVLLVPRSGLHGRQGVAEGERLIDSLQILQNTDVFEALLGHVRLVENREALVNCRADGTTVWVTPGGDLLDERGVVRGGAAGEEGGLVSRRAERDALVITCDQIKTDIDKLGVTRAEVAHGLAGAEEALAAAESHARSLHVKQERAREREQQAAVRQHAVHREIALRTVDQQELSAGLISVESKVAALLEQEQVHQVQVEADTAQQKVIEEKLHTMQAEVRAAHETVSTAKLELSKREERREALESEKKHVARGLEERGRDLELAQKELEQLADRRKGLEGEQAQLEQRSVALSDVRDACAGDLEKARVSAAELGQRQAGAQELVVESERLQEVCGVELSTRKMEAQETRIRRDELRRQVLEELEVDLDVQQVIEVPAASDVDEAEPAPLAELEVETDWEAVEAEIEELRGRLSRMGNVNLEAVDELATVLERLTFLVGQRDDLLQAQNSLTDTIRRVNKESRERFQVTFDEVREHFRGIFRKLFRGGRADICLAEGEDILEAGIEINVAPPGKDSRAITLLSGGERTLTAVGLLFALFKARPAPVCLLDEVDAALDETNIDRFCTVLEDFLGQTQFIVVTHARRTMSYSDTVFGVTMQEHGVSRVLSLTLQEFDERKEKALSAGQSSPSDGEASEAAQERDGGAESDQTPATRRELLTEDDRSGGDRLGVSSAAPEMDISAS